MSAPPVTHVSSRDNPVFKALRSLAHGNTGYRKQRRIWAEGEHLSLAALNRGMRPVMGIFSESFWPLALAEST